MIQPMIFPEEWPEDYKLLVHRMTTERKLAEKYGKCQQTIHVWKKKYAAAGEEFYPLPSIKNINKVANVSVTILFTHKTHYLFFDKSTNTVYLKEDRDAFSDNKNVLFCCEVTHPLSRKLIRDIIHKSIKTPIY